MNLASKLNQVLVYWTPGAMDRHGRPAWSAGAELTVRWQDRVEEFVNALGERELSAAVIYADGAGVVPGTDCRVYLGALASLTVPEQADPNLVQGAHTVRAVGLSPSLGAGQELAKLWTKA